MRYFNDNELIVFTIVTALVAALIGSALKGLGRLFDRATPDLARRVAQIATRMLPEPERESGFYNFEADAHDALEGGHRYSALGLSVRALVVVAPSVRVRNGWIAQNAVWIACGLTNGLFFGLATGFVSGLRFGLLHGLLFGLVFGPTMGLTMGLMIRLMIRRMASRMATFSYQNKIRPLSGLSFGLLLGLVVGLLFGFLDGLSAGLTAGLAFGTAFGLSMALVEPTSAVLKKHRQN